jgi:translocation and assembly module TamB
VEASRDVLTLSNFSAKAGSGMIQGSGTIGLLQPGLPVTLKFTARDAQPISSNLITARLDGELRLDGTWNEQLRLSGRAQISRAEINIPNAMPVTIATLDVRRPGEKRAPVAVAVRPLLVDVTITAPRAVFVRGRGLVAEVGGELHWGGTRTAPQIGGGFELRSGNFNLVGKTLDFETGRVTFNGQGVNNQFNPTLDFVANKTSGGVTAKLKVSGYADMPKVTLESTPELPLDEVLARLLFGTSVTELSALQLAQMGAAVATLSGVNITGVGSLLAVQRSLGLDRLAISDSGTDSGGATVEAGRYVSSRVYVGTKNSSNGANQARVEVDLSRQLKVHATIGTGAESVQGNATADEAGNSIGLSYDFEY